MGIKVKVLVAAGLFAPAFVLVPWAAGPAAATPTGGSSAGYIGKIGKATANVTAKVVVPTLTCTPSEPNPVSVSIQVNGASGFSGAQVVAQCGASTVATLFLDGGASSSFAVSAGDTVKLAGDPQTDSYTMKDLTTGSHVRGTGTGVGKLQSFQVTASASQDGGFPPFSPIDVSDATINGAPLSAVNPVQYDERDYTDSYVLISSSSLDSTGKRFTIDYVSNAVPPSGFTWKTPATITNGTPFSFKSVDDCPSTYPNGTPVTGTIDGGFDLVFTGGGEGNAFPTSSTGAWSGTYTAQNAPAGPATLEADCIVVQTQQVLAVYAPHPVKVKA